MEKLLRDAHTVRSNYESLSQHDRCRSTTCHTDQVVLAAVGSHCVSVAAFSASKPLDRNRTREAVLKDVRILRECATLFTLLACSSIRITSQSSECIYEKGRARALRSSALAPLPYPSLYGDC